MSFTDTTFSSSASSPDINATVSGETFAKVLDICDNTVSTDVASVTYYVLWNVDCSDVFDMSNGNQSISGESGTDLFPTSQRNGVAGYLTDVSGTSSTQNKTDYEALRDRTSSVGSSSLDASYILATLDTSMNLPPFTKTSVYLYSSIVETDTDNVDNFDTFDEGVYFDITVEDWKVTCGTTFQRDNVNETSANTIDVDLLQETITLSTGDPIGPNGKYIIELGFYVPKDTNALFDANGDLVARTDTLNSTLLQEHYEYCHGIYDQKLHSDDHTQFEFKNRIYHIGTKQVDHSLTIHQTVSSQDLTLKQMNGSNVVSNNINFLLRINITSTQDVLNT